MRMQQGIVLVLMVTLVAGCSVRPRAVVKKTPSGSAHVSAPSRMDTRAGTTGASEHVVVRGDTLYGIAFRNGLDYRDLARWNNISEPYTIYPGQRLRLQLRTPVAATPASTPTAPPARPPSGANTPATGAGSTAPTSPVVAQTPTANPPVTPAPTTPVASMPATTPVSGAATTPVLTPTQSRSVQGVTWFWPTSGQVVVRFVPGDPTQQGIGVAGTSGQPVLAAAEGEVVYSGSGLIGYGELVIIRHSDRLMSAYGHNRKRLVAEGQRVKAGQQVAEMGRMGNSRDMLHFEIRLNGKPVDPLQYLPAR